MSVQHNMSLRIASRDAIMYAILTAISAWYCLSLLQGVLS